MVIPPFIEHKEFIFQRPIALELADFIPDTTSKEQRVSESFLQFEPEFSNQLEETAYKFNCALGEHYKRKRLFDLADGTSIQDNQHLHSKRIHMRALEYTDVGKLPEVTSLIYFHDEADSKKFPESQRESPDFEYYAYAYLNNSPMTGGLLFFTQEVEDFIELRKENTDPDTLAGELACLIQDRLSEFEFYDDRPDMYNFLVKYIDRISDDKLDDLLSNLEESLNGNTLRQQILGLALPDGIDYTEVQALAKDMEGIYKLEQIGENVRDLANSPDGEILFDPLNPTIAAPDEIAEFFEKYGVTSIIVKSLEVLDNLEYALPGAEIAGSKESKAMRNDAVEALYLYAPLMELLDYQEVVAALKTAAYRYIGGEHSEYYKYAVDHLYNGVENPPNAFARSYEQDVLKAKQQVTDFMNFALAKKYAYMTFDEYNERFIDPALKEISEFGHNASNLKETIKEKVEDYVANNGQFFTIKPLREKAIGSGYPKAYRIASAVPGWDDPLGPQVHPKIEEIRNWILGSDHPPESEHELKHLVRKHLVIYTMQRLPDVFAFTAIGSNEDFTQLSKAYSQENLAETNKYHDVRNDLLGESHIQVEERSDRRLVGDEEAMYKAIHTQYKDVEGLRALERQDQYYVDNLDRTYGLLAHYIYKIMRQTGKNSREMGVRVTNPQTLIRVILNFQRARVNHKNIA